jgi:RNA polymerase nonessential primary-like sigma factor
VTAEAERGTESASETLAAAGLRGRRADREIAAALGRREPTAPTASAGYLDALTRRPVLRQAVEAEMVAAAQAGDAAARARLVESFMPMIASVAPLYRDSPADRAPGAAPGSVIALLRALERYDASRGTPFWPYARW